MNSLLRIFPFVWPHRGKILLSMFFAVIVAALWGANLSVAFPIVKVLLQGETLDGYVAAQIAQCREDIARHQQVIANMPPGRLKRLAREQADLAAASRRLVVLVWIQDHVLPWVPSDRFDTFALLLGLLVLATAVKGLCIFIQDVLVGSVVELSTMSIRKECFRKALRLDYQTLQAAGTADLMSRFTNDINVMKYGLTLLGGKLIREPLKALACVVCALWVNWRLTLMSAVFVPLMAAVFYRYGRILKQASHRMMESMSRIYKSLEETFQGLKIVIAFNGARRHRAQFHRENKEYYRKAMKVVQIDALTSPTTELLGMLAVSVAILPSAYLVLRGTDTIWGIQLCDGQMDIAQLSVLYAFLAGIIDPVRKLSSVYSKLKRAAAATERVFELFDREPQVRNPENPVPLPRHSQSVEFRNVSFTYSQPGQHGHRPPALDEVDLFVKAGEVIAVVGDNGSGKSTLVNLLPRFYDPDHGAVLIDGVDIRDVALADLRSQIGIVTQETLLFDDTIFENIRYGRPDASRDEVLAAARKAHVTDFVDRLPDGFDTVIGPMGQRLSGGQRQRIALARAIVRDPAILILDEATSAIDAQSEALIHEVLREFVQGRTVFVITHWITPRIVDFVTRIAVMEKGRLVATGTHEELMASCQTYRNLFHAHEARQMASPDEGASLDRPGDQLAAA